jgi:5-methylthioadenosine/S-adenosylhomocysteine deaminase
MSVSPVSAPRDVDLLIRHAYVITMDDEDTRYTDGAVAIDKGLIVAVGPDKELAPAYRADDVIDATGAPVHPGLIETHLHASYHTFRGALPDHLPEHLSFDSFESVFYNKVTSSDEYLSVALAAIEMIRNGTTCFMEAGTILDPDSAAGAVEQVGIRAVLGDTFIWDQPNGLAQGDEIVQNAPDSEGNTRPRIARAPQSFDEALAGLGRQLERNSDADSLVTGHVAVLGLGTASEDLMMAAKQVADRGRTVVNIHQSYSPADVAADRNRFGQDPLVHLADIGFLDSNVTLGHGNLLTDAECEALLHTGATIAWAPAASMMWGHGSCFDGRHAELYRRGANISLGSDSPNWSNSFDLFRQASFAVLTAREAHHDREYLVAEDGLYMATRGGAQAIGMQDRLGSIEVGKRADVVVHTLSRPELVPTTDVLRNLMYSAGSKSVDTVIVNGKIVLLNGRFTTIDEAAVLRDIQSASTALLTRMGRTPEPNHRRLRSPGPGNLNARRDSNIGVRDSDA